MLSWDAVADRPQSLWLNTMEAYFLNSDCPGWLFWISSLNQFGPLYTNGFWQLPNFSTASPKLWLKPVLYLLYISLAELLCNPPGLL